MFRTALTGIAVVAALGAAALTPASAQVAVSLSRTAPRVLSDITDTVKDDDGARVTLHTVLTYDPVAGEYVRTVTEPGGRLRERTVQTAHIFSPTREEDETARAIVALDPEVSGMMSRSAYPVEISGGFQLLREEGHGCGPGSRCLQYEVMQIVPGEAFARRMRFVVVDLRRLELFSADFDPATEGNLANPAARAQSRSN